MDTTVATNAAISVITVYCTLDNQGYPEEYSLYKPISRYAPPYATIKMDVSPSLAIEYYMGHPCGFYTIDGNHTYNLDQAMLADLVTKQPRLNHERQLIS